jgi:glyoxylate carboligase
MLGTDFILRSLVADGVDHLFLVPGGLVDPFMPAIGRVPGITPVVAAQEGGAAYMADGHHYPTSALLSSSCTPSYRRQKVTGGSWSSPAEGLISAGPTGVRH